MSIIEHSNGNMDFSKIKLGDTARVFVRNNPQMDTIEDVVVVDFDQCDLRHPIYEIVSGPQKGRRVLCSDTVYI